MFVVVILNEKGKIMNGKMSLLDPALQLSWPMKPGKMSTAFVHGHLGTFELVQLLPDGSLVLGGESRPRFVRPSIVVVRLRHLDVIVEADDLLLLQLVHGGSEAQLSQQVAFLLLLLLFLFRRSLRLQDVPLDQLLRGRPHRQSPDQPGPDGFLRFLLFVVRLQLQYVPIDQLLSVRSQSQLDREALLAGNLGRSVRVVLPVADRAIVMVIVVALADHVRPGVLLVLDRTR